MKVKDGHKCIKEKKINRISKQIQKKELKISDLIKSWNINISIQQKLKGM